MQPWSCVRTTKRKVPCSAVSASACPVESHASLQVARLSRCVCHLHLLTPSCTPSPFRFVQNPNVVGSGFISFPPQQRFEKPLLVQPPTISVRPASFARDAISCHAWDPLCISPQGSLWARQHPSSFLTSLQQRRHADSLSASKYDSLCSIWSSRRSGRTSHLWRPRLGHLGRLLHPLRLALR